MRSHYRFDAFSTVHTNTICMCFCFDPLSRTFSNLCVIYENAQCISVDERSKRIEMYAFSNENALVWRGPKYLIAFCRSRCRHLWRCLNSLFNLMLSSSVFEWFLIILLPKGWVRSKLCDFQSETNIDSMKRENKVHLTIIRLWRHVFFFMTALFFY